MNLYIQVLLRLILGKTAVIFLLISLLSGLNLISGSKQLQAQVSGHYLPQRDTIAVSWLTEINDLRANPAKYARLWNNPVLDSIAASPPLVFSYTLSIEARRRAALMVANGWFQHSFLDHPLRATELICASFHPDRHAKYYCTSTPHRNALLSVDMKPVKIGIGIAHDPVKRNYRSVILLE